MVVFVFLRMGVDFLVEVIIVIIGVRVVFIYGEKFMKERREIMRCFLVGEVYVFVVIGLLGRGVDFISVR